MSYTDAEMLLVTQIAYLDVPYYMEGNRYSLDEIIRVREQELLRIQQTSGLTKAQESQLNTIHNIQNMAEKNHIDYSNWRIRDVENHESATGMYACVVDTGDGNAVIGFRGSESYDGEQFYHDWVQNDFGLLNNTLTPQQQDAQRYVKSIYEKYGDDYDAFSFTGHSLGGNLAEHASLTAPKGMRNKTDRTINFDGPGFSEEYLIAHGDDVRRYGDSMEHYQWSIVGTLLLPVPGSDYRTIEAEMPADGEMPGFLLRHGTENVNLFDGSVKNGERDAYSSVMDPLSKSVELANVVFNPVSLIIPAILSVGDFLENTIEDIAEVGERVRKGIEQWIEQHFRQDTGRDYYVFPMALSTSGESFANIAQQVRAVAEEVEQIKRGLQYDGVSGFYYKNKLGFIANQINADAKKCVTAGNVLRQCAQDYYNMDQTVASMYQQI